MAVCGRSGKANESKRPLAEGHRTGGDAGRAALNDSNRETRSDSELHKDMFKLRQD